MDRYEKRALELEIAQEERFNASTQKDDFWTDKEKQQSKLINWYRRESTTYGQIPA